MLEKTEVYFGEGAPLFRRMLRFKGQGQDEQGEKQEASWAAEVTFQRRRRTVTRSFELGLLRSELSRILLPQLCPVLYSELSCILLPQLCPVQIFSERVSVLLLEVQAAEVVTRRWEAGSRGRPFCPRKRRGFVSWPVSSEMLRVLGMAQGLRHPQSWQLEHPADTRP